MTNTQKRAAVELEILAATTPDAVILPFKKEILELCEAFGNSGQSGGSAPFVATALSHAIKKLLLQEPIGAVTGTDEEWMDVGDNHFQNRRCSALFKDEKGAYYLDAIVWKGEEPHDAFTGSVYMEDTAETLIKSRQYVNFPFKPKTFYIDVKRIPISMEEGEARKLHFIEDRNNECYYTVIKNPADLAPVFKHYRKG